MAEKRFMPKVEHQSITDSLQSNQRGLGSIVGLLFKWADLNWKGLSLTWGAAFIVLFLAYKVYAEPHIERSRDNQDRLDTLEYEVSVLEHNQETMFVVMEKIYGKKVVDESRQETERFKPKPPEKVKNDKSS